MEINNLKKTDIVISTIITEAHPHYAYGFEQKIAFEQGDILTTCPTDPPPDREIFVVNEVLTEYAISVNKPIADAIGKSLRKLTTINELTAKMKDSKTEQMIREGEVRAKMHKLYHTEEFTGTIEERLLSGYLYMICDDDLTLPAEQLQALRQQQKVEGTRQVMVQTGKAGILQYVTGLKDRGLPESIIARSIWIEMIVEGVRMHVSIKNLKVTKLKKEILKLRSKECTEVRGEKSYLINFLQNEFPDLNDGKLEGSRLRSLIDAGDIIELDGRKVKVRHVESFRSIWITDCAIAVTEEKEENNDEKNRHQEDSKHTEEDRSLPGEGSSQEEHNDEDQSEDSDSGTD